MHLYNGEAVFEFLRKPKTDEDLSVDPAELPAALPEAPREVAATASLAENFSPGPALIPQEEASAENLVAPGSKIVGSMRAEGSLRVGGTIEGDLEVAHSVVVELGGRVDGDITGHDVVVQGDVVGNIYATGKLVISCSGRVQGEVHARAVAIDEGGTLQGRCSMGRPRAPKTTAEPQPRPSFLDRIVDDDEADAPLAFAPA